MFHFRTADASDAPKIAKLHATNWVKNYRGILDDHYLDFVVNEDRINVWEKRFMSPNPDMYVILAEDKSDLVGFGCVFFNEHEKYGAYLDNLHVLENYSGRGIGKALMSLLASAIISKCDRDDMYLWVLKENPGAIRLYEKLGGQRKDLQIEQELWEKPVEKIRFYWPDVRTLIHDQ